MTSMNTNFSPPGQDSYRTPWQNGTWGSRERLFVKIESEENIHVQVISQNFFARLIALAAKLFTKNKEVAESIGVSIKNDKVFTHVNHETIEDEKQKIQDLIQAKKTISELLLTIETDLAPPQVIVNTVEFSVPEQPEPFSDQLPVNTDKALPVLPVENPVQNEYATTVTEEPFDENISYDVIDEPIAETSQFAEEPPIATERPFVYPSEQAPTFQEDRFSQLLEEIRTMQFHP